jgi:hypothetical protein
MGKVRDEEVCWGGRLGRVYQQCSSAHPRDSHTTEFIVRDVFSM